MDSVAKSAFEHAQNVQNHILYICKVPYVHLLCIETFCSIHMILFVDREDPAQNYYTRVERKTVITQHIFETLV